MTTPTEIEDLHRGDAGPPAIYDWLKREKKKDFSGSLAVDTVLRPTQRV